MENKEKKPKKTPAKKKQEPNKIEVNNVKKIRARFTTVITTMDMYSMNDLQKSSVIIDTRKQIMSVKEFQRVVEVGEAVRDIKVGDIVCINPARFMVKKFEDGSLKDNVIKMNPVIDYNFPTVIIDNTPYLFLDSRDISYIVLEYE